jgi:hypothetical protein
MHTRLEALQKRPARCGRQERSVRMLYEARVDQHAAAGVKRGKTAHQTSDARTPNARVLAQLLDGVSNSIICPQVFSYDQS